MVALGSIVIALVGVEIVLRCCWTPWSLQSHQLFERHDYYGWAPRPGVQGERVTPEYRHTARNTVQRLRGKTVFGRRKAIACRTRVLFLGDSFTYGLGSRDDETFVEVFRRAHRDVEVVNGGCNGYSTRECLAVLDHLGAALAPEVAVYVFFWNDLDDNLQRQTPDYGFDAEGRVLRIDRARLSSDPLALQPVAEPTSRSPWQRLYAFDLIYDGLEGLRYHLFGVERRVVHTEALKADAWRTTAKLLAVMQRRAEEIGSKLVVVCLPDHNQVNPAAVIKNIEPLNFRVQTELAAHCRTLGISYVDLLPGMRQRWQASGEDFYYFADRHLTPRGNVAVAELLGSALAPFLAR